MRGFLQIPHALLRSGLDPILLRVYLVIASYADGKAGECTASRETIATASGCSPAMVKRSIATLKAGGLISVIERSGRSSVIRAVRPRDLSSDTYSGLTDPGSGLTDPGVGSHRPTKKTERRRQTEEDRYLKPTSGGSGRPMSDGQRTFLVDLVLLQGADADANAEEYVRGLVCSYDDADELIKEYWQAIEHIGREDVAYNAHQDPVLYARLSPRGRAFVDQNDVTL